MKWLCQDVSGEQARSLAEALGCSKDFARLLIKRGLDSADKANEFLYPRLAQLSDPFLVTHMREVIDRLLLAIEGKEHVCVMGDYDVDGVTSTTLLVSIMREFGADPRSFVPRRLEEGYGLSERALARLIAEGPLDLLIVLDSGTNAVDEVAFLRKQGVEVIIVDHHKSKDALPEDCLLINPHIHDSEADSWRYLCTVGLVFKVVHALIKALRDQGNKKAFEIKLKDYLDLVAMGTIADLMPLRRENRILTKFGLEQLSKTKRPGISALLRASGVEKGKALKPTDVSFRLGPRINASGRLADASLPIALLLEEDPKRCNDYAQQLNELNLQRQEIERAITSQAEEIAHAQAQEQGIVLYHDQWHLGVVGIVAGKLARSYQRPCIVMAPEGEYAKGSGRSVNGLNMVEVLQECEQYLDSWGGHPMAVGVSMPIANIDAFNVAFQQALIRNTGAGVPEASLVLSQWIQPRDLVMDFLDELELLQPFGEGNPEPLIGVRHGVLASPPNMFGDGHYRFQLESSLGTLVSGVAWKKADDLPPHGVPLDLAVKVNRNCWNGRNMMQLELVEWRHA